MCNFVFVIPFILHFPPWVAFVFVIVFIALNAIRNFFNSLLLKTILDGRYSPLHGEDP